MPWKGKIKVKKEGFYILHGMLCIGMSPNALEDGLRGKMRVLTKFQVNLVIPKGYLWLFFNQREGYVFRGILYIFKIGGGEINRDLHSRVSS